MPEDCWAFCVPANKEGGIGMEVFWFLPTSGDGSYVGTSIGQREVTFNYLKQITTSVEELGFDGMLIPTGEFCEESWSTASSLITYTNRLKQLEDIANGFKGVDKSFAIQAGREVRVMVVPEQVSDANMVLLARDISKQIEAELEYPGQIKVNVIRESRVTDFAK